MGTSTLGGMASGYFKDHPHACGDKPTLFAASNDKGGSSPRVWGQDKRAWNNYTYRRIIPTRVGTRKKKQKKSQSTTDHPHACGDKISNSGNV